MFWDKLAIGMFLFLELCSEKAMFATHLEKSVHRLTMEMGKPWENKTWKGADWVGKLLQTKWGGESGLSYQEDVLQRSLQR